MVGTSAQTIEEDKLNQKISRALLLAAGDRLRKPVTARAQVVAVNLGPVRGLIGSIMPKKTEGISHHPPARMPDWPMLVPIVKHVALELGWC